ncbi:hypothetical protein HDU96_005719 [Phlyctochytrium bullatum]|nr:hypothetical protein HDU96_005719 [Phlyctochytrium bullatum]
MVQRATPEPSAPSPSSAATTTTATPPANATTAIAAAAANAAPSTATSAVEARRIKTKEQLLSQGIIRFQDVFWGKGEDPVEGVRVLHEVFLRHLAEVEDLIALLRVRVAIEEMNAARLGELGRLSGLPGSAAMEAQNLLMGGIGLSPSSMATGQVPLGVGRRGPGTGGSGFISTGNGITSVGNQPVPNNNSNLFGSLTGLVMSVATNISSITTTNTPASPVTSSGGVGSGNMGVNINANAMGGFHSAPTDGRETPTALASDALAYSAAGANGFTDDASSLLPVVRTLREQMMAMAAVHRRHADNLTLNVLSPLTAFADQNRRMLAKKKAEVDAAYSQYHRIASDIEGRRQMYFSKTKMAYDEEEKFRRDGEARANPPKLGPILFGSRSIPLQEFHDIVNLLKREIKTKGILTPVGLFEGCFLGEDALVLLQVKYPKSPRSDIRDLCQEFVTRRCISPVIGGADGKFSASLPYCFGRPLLKTGEAPHIRSRKDADIAKLEYEASIGSSESARTVLEQAITEYLIVAQEAETFRLTIARHALHALEAAQVFVINEIGSSWRPTGEGLTFSGGESENGDSEEPVILLPPDAETGIQHISERYRTGHVRIPPIIFESFEEGHIATQTFGVSLDDIAEVHEIILPLVVQKCVGSLAFSFRQGVPLSGIEAWLSTNLDYPSIQFLRQEMNKLDVETLKGVNMKRYPPLTVANVLRMYLVELPSSVCSYEMYDAVKAIYSKDDATADNTEARLKSLKSLIKTFTKPHMATLQVLATYFSEITKPVPPTDRRFKRFCWSIAPLILRPQTTTRETLADEHPVQFVEDILAFHTTLFKTEIALEDVTIFPEIEVPAPPEPQPEPPTPAEVAARLAEEDAIMKERRKVKKSKLVPEKPAAEDPKSPAQPPANVKSYAQEKDEKLAESLKDPTSAAAASGQTEHYNAAVVIDNIIATSEQPAASAPQTKNANWLPWSAKYTQASNTAEGEAEEGDDQAAVDNPAAEEISKEEAVRRVAAETKTTPQGEQFEVLGDKDALTLKTLPLHFSNAVETAAKALTSDQSPLTAAGAAAIGEGIKNVAGSMVSGAARAVKKAVARRADAVAAAKEAKAPLAGDDEEEDDAPASEKAGNGEEGNERGTSEEISSESVVAAEVLDPAQVAPDEEGKKVSTDARLSSEYGDDRKNGVQIVDPAEVDAASVWQKD